MGPCQSKKRTIRKRDESARGTYKRDEEEDDMDSGSDDEKKEFDYDQKDTKKSKTRQTGDTQAHRTHVVLSYATQGLELGRMYKLDMTKFPTTEWTYNSACSEKWSFRMNNTDTTFFCPFVFQFLRSKQNTDEAWKVAEFNSDSMLSVEKNVQAQVITDDNVKFITEEFLPKYLEFFTINGDKSFIEPMLTCMSVQTGIAIKTRSNVLLIYRPSSSASKIVLSGRTDLPGDVKKFDISAVDKAILLKEIDKLKEMKLLDYLIQIGDDIRIVMNGFCVNGKWKTTQRWVEEVTNKISGKKQSDPRKFKNMDHLAYAMNLKGQLESILHVT